MGAVGMAHLLMGMLAPSAHHGISWQNQAHAPCHLQYWPGLTTAFLAGMFPLGAVSAAITYYRWGPGAAAGEELLLLQSLHGVGLAACACPGRPYALQGDLHKLQLRQRGCARACKPGAHAPTAPALQAAAHVGDSGVLQELDSSDAAARDTPIRG